MIEENEQLPDWLVELRDQQIQQQSQEPPPPVAPEPQGEMDQASLMGDLRSQMSWAEEQMAQDEVPADPHEVQAAPPESVRAPIEEPIVEPESEEPADMLDSLREQMIQAAGVEEELELMEGQSPLQSLLSLKPPQRLLLAVLVFLNVAVCGCLILIMAGRVEIPAF